MFWDYSNFPLKTINHIIVIIPVHFQCPLADGRSHVPISFSLFELGASLRLLVAMRQRIVRCASVSVLAD